MRQSAHILLVEDNPADSYLISSALSNGGASTKVTLAQDGHEASQLLARIGTDSQPKPDLIILDLNMPKKDGRTLLAEIKADPKLRCIPVIIFTSSEADSDINVAYGHHANTYFAKPPDLDEYTAILGRIKQYWLADAKLPTNCVCG